jgi:hypothetical protein
MQMVVEDALERFVNIRLARTFKVNPSAQEFFLGSYYLFWLCHKCLIAFAACLIPHSPSFFGSVVTLKSAEGNVSAWWYSLRVMLFMYYIAAARRL